VQQICGPAVIPQTPHHFSSKPSHTGW
jgi:hypothetical protein